MARLVEALRELGLNARVVPSGRWVELEGGRCRAHVAAAPRDAGFYAWCDDPKERTVEHHADPVAAIRAGLRRAALETADSGRTTVERPGPAAR